MRSFFWTGIVGLLFGVSLSRMGFSSWDEVHAMFNFSSLRLVYYTFCLAVALLAIGWYILRKLTHPHWSKRKVHPGTLPGGIIFGIGWSLTGACPSIALVQLGEAQGGALLTLAGIFVGNWLYSIVHERYFHWTSQGCSDD